MFSEDTRTMHTEVDVPNPGRVLLPGLYAEATITLEKKDDAIAVPLQAVDQEDDQATVDVVDPSNKIEIRPVVLGIQTADRRGSALRTCRKASWWWSAIAAV